MQAESISRFLRRKPFFSKCQRESYQEINSVVQSYNAVQEMTPIHEHEERADEGRAELQLPGHRILRSWFLPNAHAMQS
jgi:hypothetical protein